MSMRYKDGSGCGEKHKRGVSSFNMHDSAVVFKELDLKKGNCFLDLGCGSGDYSMEAARKIEETGSVYALDRWVEVINKVREKTVRERLNNIRTMVSDITSFLPIKSGTVDVCLMATVLHIPDVLKRAESMFGEIKRVLKEGGRLAVIEIKKEKTPFGPPMYMRLSPEEIEEMVRPKGFKKISLVELGNNYMIQFRTG